MRTGARLRAVIAALDGVASLADIGYDHGQVLLACARDGVWPCIGVDPDADCSRRFHARAPHLPIVRARGVRSLAPGSVEAVVLAGLGEAHIRTILLEAEAFLASCHRLVVCPTKVDGALHLALGDRGWRARHEELVQERGRLYRITCFARGKEQETRRWRLAVGPRLFERNDPLLNVWQDRLRRAWKRPATEESP